MRVHAHGTGQLDPQGTYVFMANHLSHVDIVSLFVALPIGLKEPSGLSSTEA